MDPDLLAPLFSPSEIPADDDLMVKDLPELAIACATIKITHKHVLKKAAKKLSVLIHGYNFSSLGGEEIIASVTMDIPAYPGNPAIKNKVFCGEWSIFSSEAKDTACLAALTYLKDQGLIIVHDHNFAELTTYKQKYVEQQFWSAPLYDRAVILKEKLSGKATNTIPSHQQISDDLATETATPPPSSSAVAKSPEGNLKGGAPQHHAIKRVLFPDS